MQVPRPTPSGSCELREAFSAAEIDVCEPSVSVHSICDEQFQLASMKKPTLERNRHYS
jgi:hypothetical protein